MKTLGKFIMGASKVVIAIFAAVILLIIVVVAVAVGSSHNTVAVKKPVTPPTSAPPAAAPTTPAPASSPAQTTTGPLGTTFTDSGQNDAGNNFALNVTATQVDQHAKFSNSYESLTTPGSHLVAVQFKLTEQSGSDSDDANSNAVVVGSDGQDYTPTFDQVANGTNFNSGEYNLSAGQSVTGWVSFELPAGVSVAQVQWTPDGGFSDNAATWTVNGG